LRWPFADDLGRHSRKRKPRRSGKLHRGKKESYRTMTDTPEAPRPQVIFNADDDEIEAAARRARAQGADDEQPWFPVEGRSTWRDPAIIKRREWLYGDHYLRGAVSSTVADGGIGKSTLALAEAVAMSTGRNILGVPVKRSLNVFYWNGEDDIDEIERRVAAVCVRYGIDRAELTGRLQICSGHDFPITIATAGRNGIEFDTDWSEGGHFASLWKYEDSADVLIIDPFVQCHRVPENDNTAIDAVVKCFGANAKKYKLSIDLVHHARKPAQGGLVDVSASDARGASAFINAVRSARTLNRMTEAEGERGRVNNHRHYFRVDNAKANYAPPDDTATWFKKVGIAIGNGDEVATVVPWRFPGAFDNITTAHMEMVRTTARAGTYRESPRSPEWLGYAVADVCHLDADIDRKRITELIRVWVGSGVLKVVLRKGADRHPYSFIVPGDWTADEGAGVDAPDPRNTPA
jgi:hypothetical protein